MGHSKEQKTIAKNTIFLYLRMFVVMFVTLYTSRVVLDKLGVEDYGIYNIVGSIVVSFAFVKNALMSATQRFLSYKKGEGEGEEGVSAVFSMSLNIHILLMLLILILLESLGAWFFYEVIKIPEERQAAAFIVYQFSILTFCVSLIQVPYTTLIVSNERMSIYAFLSIIEVVLKLGIVYALSIGGSIDKLILYGALMFSISAVCAIATIAYCRLQLKNDSNYRLRWDKQQFKEIMEFSSWNLVGGVSSITTTEGPNYFMNYYLGVSVNAAMGIAKQVSTAVYNFSANFQTAFNPQIVKSYASKDFGYFFDLVFRTSKMSFFLVYVITLPLIICCNDILSLWLKIVPEYTCSFCICILIAQLISAISSPFWMAAHAIGDIKKYQLILVFFNLAILPTSWIVLYLHFEPYLILISQVFLNIGVLIFRVSYLHVKVGFPTVKYYSEVVLKELVLIPLITCPVAFYLKSLCPGLLGVFIVCTSSVILTSVLFVYIGLNNSERDAVLALVKSKICRR